MDSFQIIFASVLAACLAGVFYAYAGYPVLIAVLSRVFGRRPVPPNPGPDADLPAVTLLIAAHNEQAEIRARIENALALDYPAGRLEIVVASDGSTDRTNGIVREYAGRGVRLLAYPRRRGKASVLNDAFGAVTGDLVVLSDANTHTDPQAVRKLVRWFADPAVGSVCGRLVLTDPRTGRNADGLYWKYETFLKRCEARLGALLGANGAIYAIRRPLFPGLPPQAVADDMLVPLLARLRTGCRIVYDAEAVAAEETPPGIGSEFRRRCRLGAGGFQSLGLLGGMFRPRHGWLAFAFVSHKVLRWAGPFLLIGALLANTALVTVPFFQALLLAQVGFYALSLAAGRLPASPKPFKVLRLSTMFTAMNAALLMGFLRWLRGKQRAAWERTVRLGELAPARLARVGG